MIVRYHIQILKNMVHILRIKILLSPAEGSAKDKTFESETKTIKASKLKDNTTITLDFDSDEIDKYVAKKKKKKIV